MSFRPYVDWYRLKVGVFVPCYIRKSINLNEMMIKNKILALLTVGLLLLMVMPTLARQQQRVRGIVRDSLTSDPIAGAAVKVVGTPLGTSTDTEGRFILTCAPEGAAL